MRGLLSLLGVASATPFDAYVQWLRNLAFRKLEVSDFRVFAADLLNIVAQSEDELKALVADDSAFSPVTLPKEIYESPTDPVTRSWSDVAGVLTALQGVVVAHVCREQDLESYDACVKELFGSFDIADT